MDKLTEQKLTKDNVMMMSKIGKDTVNSEIFMACRFLQENAQENGNRITNIGEVYHWIIEERDRLLKAS